MKITKTLKWTYISLLKKHPKGMQQRLPHFDRWVVSCQLPHTQTYYQIFNRMEQGHHYGYIPICPKAKAAFDAAQFNHRPGLAQFHRRLFPTSPRFVDDNELTQDIKDLNLKIFFRGFLQKESRTDLQRLFVWGTVSIVFLCLYFYSFVIKADDDEYVVQLEPHESYFHYRIQVVKELVNMCIEKIDFLRQHADEELKKAKERALERKKSRSL